MPKVTYNLATTGGLAMRTRIILFSASILISFLFAIAKAAYLESDYADSKQPTHVEPLPKPIPPPIPIPPGHHVNPLTQLMDNISIGRAYHYRELTIFPLNLSRAFDSYDYVTLDDAIRRGYLRISEKDSPSVSEVVVWNDSGRYVFLMAGEIIVGGKQNRTIKQDVLLSPRSGPVVVPVYCVEKGRWDNGARGLKSGSTLFSFSLRKRIQKSASQEEIWNSIRSEAGRLGVQSKTEDFQRVYEDSKVASELGDYRQEFLRILPRRMAGMVVVRGYRVIGADVFCNSMLFEKLRGKILESYALEVIKSSDYPQIQSPEWSVVRNFLMRIYRAEFWYAQSSGAGRVAKLGGVGISGDGITFSGNVLHFSLAPRPMIRPLPGR